MADEANRSANEARSVATLTGAGGWPLTMSGSNMRPRPGRSPTPERHGANDRSPQHRRSSGLSAETAAADAAAAGTATAESPASIATPPDGAPIGGSLPPDGTSILPALPAHTPSSPVARRKSPVPTEVIASPSTPPKMIRQLDPPLASEPVGVGTLGAAEHASGGSGYSPFPSDSTPNPIHGPGGQPPIQPVVGLGLSGPGIGNIVRSKSRGPGQAGLLRMSKMVVEGDEEDGELCSGGNKSNCVVRIAEPNGDVALNSDPSGGRLAKIKGSQGNVLRMMGSTMSRFMPSLSRSLKASSNWTLVDVWFSMLAFRGAVAEDWLRICAEPSGRNFRPTRL